MTQSSSAPFVDLGTALKIREDWRKSALITGLTVGCFDIVHDGHIDFLTRASYLCDRLIVVLSNDDTVAREKGAARPIQPLAARAAVICALRGVDVVLAFYETSPLVVIETLAPDRLFKGPDYRDKVVIGSDAVARRGGISLIIGNEPLNSTTRIIERLAGRNKA